MNSVSVAQDKTDYTRSVATQILQLFSVSERILTVCVQARTFTGMCVYVRAHIQANPCTSTPSHMPVLYRIHLHTFMYLRSIDITLRMRKHETKQVRMHTREYQHLHEHQQSTRPRIHAPHVCTHTHTIYNTNINMQYTFNVKNLHVPNMQLHIRTHPLCSNTRTLNTCRTRGTHTWRPRCAASMSV